MASMSVSKMRTGCEFMKTFQKVVSYFLYISNVTKPVSIQLPADDEK